MANGSGGMGRSNKSTAPSKAERKRAGEVDAEALGTMQDNGETGGEPADDNGGETRYRAPALEKGLDILELLAQTPDGLSQAQIAKRLGRSVSELFRMLNCLQRRGYVALKRPEDVYVLTLKMFEISHRHPPVKRLISEALPHMRALVREIDQSCHLAVFHNDRVLVVAQVDSPGHLGFAVRMGAEVDLLATASGRVLLAFASEADRESLLNAYFRDGPANAYDPTELEIRLSAIRERGFEEMDSHQIRGVRNISFPILDFRGEAIAALTIPFLDRIDGQHVAGVADARAALSQTTLAISDALGAQAARPAPIVT